MRHLFLFITKYKRASTLEKLKIKKISFSKCVDFRLVYGKLWTISSFLETPTLLLESALRQYDTFLVLILFQHQTILSVVKSFFEDTEWPCVMVGSAFEGCFLPKHLNTEKKVAVEFDFLVRLPLPIAGESTESTLQYVSPSGKHHEVVLKLSDPSVLLSTYIGIENRATNGIDTFLSKAKDGFLKINFMEAVEEKIKNSLRKVLEQKPGGMEMVSRRDTKYCVGLHPSLKVSFLKPITERLDMLPLDPETWSGDAMTNAQMLFVNLTNWGAPLWPVRIFNIHLAIQCEWPEDVRTKWLQRDRFWPSDSTVQKVATSSCYLIPLWENVRKDELIDKEVMQFQMTFGMAEYLFFSETGPKERQCLVILKSLKENYFIRSQIISSFTIKTVFFWYLQSTSLPMRQSLGRGELLERLLDDLIGFLNERNLPHFFIPSVNLLGTFDAEDINNTVKQLKEVKNNLLNYLCSELFHVEGSTLISEDFVNQVLCLV